MSVVNWDVVGPVLAKAVMRAWEDVNWMTNEQSLLNRDVFKYLDDVKAIIEEAEIGTAD